MKPVMKPGDAVRVNSPGNPADDLIGHIEYIKNGKYWVSLAESRTVCGYKESELVAVRPEL